MQGFLEAKGPKKLLINTGNPQRLFLDPLIEDQLARWYDHWLKGIDTGLMDEPPVRVHVRNGPGYRDEAEWPPKGVELRKLYLAPGPSGATESLNDGRLTWDVPTGDSPPTEYSYPNPEWTFPGIGSAVRGHLGLSHDTRRIVTFTSEPVTEEIEVTGPVALHIWAASTSEDTQFIVRVMDIAPMSPELRDAVRELDIGPPANVVAEGWLKASHRELDPERSTELVPYHTHTRPEPLEPGEVYEFVIEVWPTSWVFRAGHRIRLDVMPLDQQGYYYYGQLVGTDSLHHDVDRPSHLLLPVVPAERNRDT